MSIYWLIVDNKGPLSLIKTSGQKTVVIAGNARGTQGFRSGNPNTFISEPWYYEFVTDKCYHPLVGEWIDKLGPVEDSAQRLKKLREKEAKQKIANAKRERAKNLTDTELSDIRDMLGRGVDQNYIAEKHGVSEPFIRRLAASNRQKVPEIGVGDFEASEAPRIGPLRGAEFERVGGVA